MNWFQSGKYNFYFWNQFRILVRPNLQKSPPWKMKSPLNLVNHEIAPWGAISPTLNITGLNSSSLLSKSGSQTHGPRGNFVRSAMRLGKFIQTTPKLFNLCTGV